MFPSADRIAVAIVMAARFHGDDPLSVASGGGGNRGRSLAYGALTEAFSDVMKAKVARWCGFPSQSAASAHLIHARRARWWNEDHVDEIVGALVEEDYASREVPEASPPVAPPLLCAPAASRQGRATMRDGRSPLRPSADVEIPHFEADERRLIARMRAGGADAGAIAAALGASADEVGAWLAANG